MRMCRIGKWETVSKGSAVHPSSSRSLSIDLSSEKWPQCSGSAAGLRGDWDEMTEARDEWGMGRPGLCKTSEWKVERFYGSSDPAQQSY